MLPFFKIAIGTWAWGNRLIWDYGIDFEEKDLESLVKTAISDGSRYFFTSESFSDGFGEALLGRLTAPYGNAFLATKYVPRVWRFGRKEFDAALRRSLARLGRDSIDLYLLERPTGWMGLDLMAECAAEGVEAGRIRNVGAANFRVEDLEPFRERLAQYGVALTAVAGEYNLLNREAERNGALAYCRAQNIPFLAESPLAMGLLTGKYIYDAPANGVRRSLAERFRFDRLDLLIHLLNAIGSEYQGMDCGQVALNWVSAKGAIPVAGAKTSAQEEHNRLSFGFTLTEDQIAHIQEFAP